MIRQSIYRAMALMALLSWTARSEVMVIPFQLDKVDSANAATINELFAESYQTFTKDTIAKPDGIASCRDKTCALEAGKRAGASEAVYGVARQLGNKWIVSGWRVKVADGSILASSTLDSKSIGDFEFVMKRIAQGLATGKKIEETADIDNVTETEMSEEQFRRRQGYYAFGFKFGFLFPPAGRFYSRYEYDYSSSLYSGSHVVLKKYSQVLNTDFVNWFELPKDLALEWDLHVGWANEVGTHFSLLKLFSRKDFAPFAGGGIGLDYVFPDGVDSIAKDKRNGGFAINGKAGMILFRTYDFRVFTTLGYKIVFNSDLDQGISADMGIIWKKQRSSAHSSGNPVVAGLAIVGGVVLGIIVLGVALQ
ncbi:MAG: hypothetical protein PHC61_11455 [Chitinivibrionales bacterium]|nr:hypothetical protein [Chitinivibrionales bacterium]